MATSTNGTPRHTRGRQTESLAHWLLGALGLLWVGTLTFKSFRERRLASAVEPLEPKTNPTRLRHRTHVFGYASSEPIRGHERRDANAKWIFGVIIFLLLFGLGIHGILAAFLHVLNNKPPPQDGFRPVSSRLGSRMGQPSYPLLQVSPPGDLGAFRSREQAELQGYGWVDRTSGIVRIPIDRAMDLVLKEGLPTRNQAGQQQTGPSSYQLLQDRTEHRQEEIIP